MSAVEPYQYVDWHISMFEGQTQDPKAFIDALRQFHEASVAGPSAGDTPSAAGTVPPQSPAAARGELANALSDAIIHKRVDLGAVRQALIGGGEDALMATLDQLCDLIEPYIEEGGAEE